MSVVAGIVAGRKHNPRPRGAALIVEYVTRVLDLSPLGYWRLDEASGATAADSAGTNDGTYQNTGAIEYSIDPLVSNSNGGKSIGLSGASTSTPHVTITDLVSAATFTLDIAVQLDRQRAKHVLITQGLGASDNGAISLEAVDDGAGGLELRQWTSDGVTAHVWTTGADTVPVGEACKITYVQEEGVGRRLYVDGVQVGGTNTDLTTFVQPPAGTWYIGTWPNGTDATDGLIAELASWNSALTESQINGLARATSVVWLADSDIGSAVINQTETIDLAPLAHPASGFTPAIVTNGSLGTASVSGEDIDYAAGGTTGTDDTFTATITRGGITSRTATFTIDVIEAAIGIQLESFGYKQIDDAVPAGAVWWDPTNGSDGNDGSTKTLAKATFSAAETAASTSNRIILAGGAAGSTTYHAVGEIVPSKSGTGDGDRMELFAEPGRKVVLCRDGDFIGGLDQSWSWTEIDSARKIYESEDIGIGDPATSVTANAGTTATGDGWIACFLELAGKGSHGLTHLMYVPWVDLNDIANDGDGLPQDGGYGGPWIASTGTGRLQIRLTPPTESVAGNEWPTDGIMGELIAGDGTWQEPSGTANDYVMHLMRFDGSYGSGGNFKMFDFSTNSVDWWHIKGVNLDLCAVTAHVGGNTGIKFESLTIYALAAHLRRFGSTADIDFLRCHILTGDLRSVAWREYKNNGGYWFQHTRSALMEDKGDPTGSGNLTYERCTMFGWFDHGLFDDRDAGKHLYDHCAILNTVDDGFYQSSFIGDGSGDLEVSYSYLFGGPDRSGGGGAPTGPEFHFHHNVIDHRVPLFWRSYGVTTSGVYGVGPNMQFPHSSNGYRPIKWYHNTIITSANQGKGLGRGVMISTSDGGHDLPSGVAHEVYNNLLCVIAAFRYPTPDSDNDPLVSRISCDLAGAGCHRYDFNLYFRSLAWAATTDPWLDIQDSQNNNRSNYTSLADFRSSAHKTTSESMYASTSGAFSGSDGTDGHEANGVEEDPQFVDIAARDYRPQSAGATSGALDLSATGWPGAANESWKGALDPSGNGNEVGPLAP